MSSLIAIKVKTKVCLVSIRLSLLSALTYEPLFKLIPRIQQYLFVLYSYLLTTFLQVTLVHYSSHMAIRCSAHNLFVNNALIR